MRPLEQIPKLQAALNGGPMRLKPRPGRTMDRRRQLENTLLMRVRDLRQYCAEGPLK
jgi:hypothetical protein